MTTRREFMAGTVAASGALLLETPLSAAAMPDTEPQWLIVDYNVAHACHFAAGASRDGCRIVALSGDSVRFARNVFAPSAPDVIGGVTAYADFVVLTGCAAEAGYRLISERAEGALMRWKVARLSRATCSG